MKKIEVIQKKVKLRFKTKKGKIVEFDAIKVERKKE